MKLQLNQNIAAYLEENREAWNKKTEIHYKSDFYNVKGFLNGENTLNLIELDALGEVENKKILHLQCHFGLDTLSLSRMGASVTGVDFSETGIQYAQLLAVESKLKAKFVNVNVYDLSETITEKYDIVFCSYGSICWLPDLDEWAKIISNVLKTNGFFYIVDFHPMLNSLDCLLSNTERSYFNTNTPFERHWKGTYAKYDDEIETIEYNWNHSLGEVFQSLVSSGLKIESLNEYSYLPINWFPNLVQSDDKMYRVKDHEDKYPLLFAIKAVK